MQEANTAIAHCDSPVASIHFLGLDLADLDTAAAGAMIAARPPGAPFAYIVTPNAQHFVLLDRERKALARATQSYPMAKSPGRLTDAYNHAWLRLSDSQVVRLLARLFHGLRLPLAAGSDLTAWLFANVIKPNDTITVIGGDAELERRLRAQFHLTRLSLHAPPMGYINNQEAVAACVDFVRAHPARFIFLATGAPQSEYLARRLSQERGITGVGLCIGGSLLFITGITTRAPVIFRRLGLEWLHRVLSNPRRFVRRLFVDSVPVIPMVMRDAFSRQRSISADSKQHDIDGRDSA